MLFGLGITVTEAARHLGIKDPDGYGIILATTDVEYVDAAEAFQAECGDQCHLEREDFEAAIDRQMKNGRLAMGFLFIGMARIDTGTKKPVPGTEAYGVVCLPVQFSWVKTQDALPGEQQPVVVISASGVMSFGRMIEGRFCEYHPDVDRFVDSEMEWGGTRGIQQWMPIDRPLY